jgi:Zyg-11 family protein
LDAICDNILLYVKSDHTTNNDLNKGKRYKFADSDLFLFKEISEKLLGKFIEKNILCDALMFLFNENNTKLSTVKLKNCNVTQTGLQILKQHKILDLECVNLKNVCIGNILDCLNEWSIKNMSNVNFSKCTFIDMQRHSLMVKITNLKNLRSLNLSHTELNQLTFQMVCEDLRSLEKLDISGTSVKDLNPLLLLSKHLISLSISVSTGGNSCWESCCSNRVSRTYLKRKTTFLLCRSCNSCATSTSASSTRSSIT